MNQPGPRRLAPWALIASALVPLACGTPRSGPPPGQHSTPTAAWWLDVAFAPTSATVRGIDVRTIDPRWLRATTLDVPTLRRHVSPAEARELLASPLSFSITTDLDRDGVREEFFVGVFEAAGGRTGRFVAITRGGRLVQHFAEEGTPGFSALLRTGDEVRWYSCLECDNFWAVRWSGSSYVID